MTDIQAARFAAILADMDEAVLVLIREFAALAADSDRRLAAIRHSQTVKSNHRAPAPPRDDLARIPSTI